MITLTECDFCLISLRDFYLISLRNFYLISLRDFFLTNSINMNILLNGKIPSEKTINATFNCFKFGNSVHERPYILRDKKATKQDLSNLFS